MAADTGFSQSTHSTRGRKDLVGLGETDDVLELGRQVVGVCQCYSKSGELRCKQSDGKVDRGMEIEQHSVAGLELAFVEEPHAKPLSVQLETPKAVALASCNMMSMVSTC